MGLELTEIAVAIEERFGIEIPDSAAAALATPGELIDYVAGLVDALPEEGCYTQRLFYRLRRGFRVQIPALVTQFRPDTPLAELLHKDQWPRVWAAIRQTTGEAYWPAEVPWATLWKTGPKTVEDLIWAIVHHLPRGADVEDRRWTSVEVEIEIREIIREIGAVGPFRLRERFVEDLGLG
jgi:hypothetical protein